MNEKSARRPSTVATIIVLERVARRARATRHVYRADTDVVFSTPFERRALPIPRHEAGASKSGDPPGAY